MIDLRSDTTTLPSMALRECLQHAEVGDDSFGEDKSVNRFQDYCRELFNVEEALFVTSGMLANRLAVLSQTSRGDEIATEYGYHINFFDSGATAALCGVVINAKRTQDGILRVEDIEEMLASKPRYHVFAQLKLITLENTINSRQGQLFPYEELQRIRTFSKTKGLGIHLDGARLFNAHIACGIPLAGYAEEVDTLSVCFSKGLGAPFGSMLMGKKDIIEKAKRFRVWLGSGYHQIGFYAEAAYFALTQQMERLKEDHRLTKILAEKISIIKELKVDPHNISTNMIFLDTEDLNVSSQDFLDECSRQGVLLFPWLPTVVRAVIHRDIEEDQIQKASEVILKVSESFLTKKTVNQPNET